jgi:hypothetical protein
MKILNPRIFLQVDFKEFWVGLRNGSFIGGSYNWYEISINVVPCLSIVILRNTTL